MRMARVAQTAGGAAGAGSGLRANAPDPTLLPDGFLYVCRDIPETLRVESSAWVRLRHGWAGPVSVPALAGLTQVTSGSGTIAEVAAGLQVEVTSAVGVASAYSTAVDLEIGGRGFTSGTGIVTVTQVWDGGWLSANNGDIRVGMLLRETSSTENCHPIWRSIAASEKAVFSRTNFAADVYGATAGTMRTRPRGFRATIDYDATTVLYSISEDGVAWHGLTVKTFADLQWGAAGPDKSGFYLESVTGGTVPFKGTLVHHKVE